MATERRKPRYYVGDALYFRSTNGKLFICEVLEIAYCPWSSDPMPIYVVDTQDGHEHTANETQLFVVDMEELCAM